MSEVTKMDLQVMRNKMDATMNAQRKLFDDAYVEKMSTKNPPTPMHLVKQANKQKVDSLINGSSTSLNFDSSQIRVTKTINGQVGFFEEDVLAHLELTEDNFPQAKRDMLRSMYEGIYFDPDDRLLILEPGLYCYSAFSETEAALNFMRWVNSEVLPCVRMSGLYAQGTVDGKSITELFRQIEMSHKLLVDRVDHNQKHRDQAYDSFVKQESLDRTFVHIKHILAEHQAEQFVAFKETTDPLIKRLDALTKDVDGIKTTVGETKGDVSASVRVFQEALMPDNRRLGLLEAELVEEVVVHKPTEDQVKLYNLLHYQASTCVEKRIVTSVFRSKFESFEGSLLDKDKEKSLLDWVAKGGPEKLESFLKSCAEFVAIYGMKPLTLDLAKQINKDYTAGSYGRLDYAEVRSILKKK
jgi:prophage antirepressor-like protein